ncbi:hypothetical protein GCM10009533_13000 [Saccharopolyspora spinosporotrichia]|uniref:Transposase n=1 Tax=Saccharopolyspora erythraea TaxID=1836 RepID=A0ABP3M8J5_SACER
MVSYSREGKGRTAPAAVDHVPQRGRATTGLVIDDNPAHRPVKPPHAGRPKEWPPLTAPAVRGILEP